MSSDPYGQYGYYGNTESVAVLLTGLLVGLPGLLGVMAWLLHSRNSKPLTVVNAALVSVALVQCLCSPVLVHELLGGRCPGPELVCSRFKPLWLACR